MCAEGVMWWRVAPVGVDYVMEISEWADIFHLGCLGVNGAPPWIPETEESGGRQTVW